MVHVQKDHRELMMKEDHHLRSVDKIVEQNHLNMMMKEDHHRGHRGVGFKEIVPISGRERDGKAQGRGPGRWLWIDALDMKIEAQMWQSREWQGSDGIRAKNRAMMKLLACFNSMFPPVTEGDAETWAKLEWTVTKVTNTKVTNTKVTNTKVTNTNLDPEVYKTTFDLSSVGESTMMRHVLQFYFNPDLTEVLVSYKGPVLFDMRPVQAARERVDDDLFPQRQ
jgi:hypothetical protein